MAFEAFRQYGAPTFYDAVHIPWEGDILTSGLIFCFGILALSFYIILPGLVGKEKAFTFIRITVNLYIGAVILGKLGRYCVLCILKFALFTKSVIYHSHIFNVLGLAVTWVNSVTKISNFAMTWETAETKATTKYKAGTGQNVNVSVGVNIGFRGINITLKGEKDQIEGETIDYNENFNWEGLQGRLGFGPFAGQFNKQFRAAQIRGIPLPILAVAEYFTLDGEGIRWGRFYRQAGWYSHIALWLAFPLWILSNILFFVLLRYGAYFLVLTGLSMITSNIIWATLRNPTDLKIHFSVEDTLVFAYGAAFWICLITGIICVLLGIIIFLLDKLLPTQVATFFGVDVLQDSENILIEEEEEPVITDRSLKVTEDAVDSSSALAIQDRDTEEDEDIEGLYLVPPPPVLKVSSPDGARPFVMRTQQSRRKSFRTSEHRLTKKLQRPRRRDPPPRPPSMIEEGTDGDYINAPARRAEPGGTAHYLRFGEGGSIDDLNEDAASASVAMTGFKNN